MKMDMGNMDMNMNMTNMDNIKQNKNNNNEDNSIKVVNNTTGNPGGIVISNTANTNNDTTNDTVNDELIANDQYADQSTETGSGISMDLVIFGIILVGIFMYNRKNRRF
tara:strand:- start:2679 stop:3005 length:327 start_codon:yes stop_codon:yes gene_type:complete